MKRALNEFAAFKFYTIGTFSETDIFVCVSELAENINILK